MVVFVLQYSYQEPLGSHLIGVNAGQSENGLDVMRCLSAIVYDAHYSKRECVYEIVLMSTK